MSDFVTTNNNYDEEIYFDLSESGSELEYSSSDSDSESEQMLKQNICEFCEENEIEFTCQTCFDKVCYLCRDRCNKCMETICPGCETQEDRCKSCLEDNNESDGEIQERQERQERQDEDNIYTCSYDSDESTYSDLDE